MKQDPNIHCGKEQVPPPQGKQGWQGEGDGQAVRVLKQAEAKAPGPQEIWNTKRNHTGNISTLWTT